PSARALGSPRGAYATPLAFFQMSGVLPGTGTGSTGSFISHDRFSGNVSSFEFSAASHVTGLPVYADMRPMMAVRVLSATCLNSLIGLAPRIHSIRSVCSCTYGL